MADPCRLKILDSIDTHLKLITTANGYKTDIGSDSVFRYISHDPFVPLQKIPLLQFAPAADALSLVEHRPSAHLEQHLNVNIVFWDAADLGRDAHEKASFIEDDLIYNMLTEDILTGTEPAYRKGGNATQTLYLSSITSEGDWLKNDTRRLLKAVFRFQVWFQRETDRS